jgi:glutathione S-transferase
MAAVGAAVAEANAAFAILDAHLASQPFVAGDSFTMGDIPVGALAYRWLTMENVERPPFPALAAWQNRLAQRSAFRAHVMLPLS